jgi:peptidase U32-like protein
MLPGRYSRAPLSFKRAGPILTPMRDTRAFLESIGLPPGDLHELPESDKRFPDGAHFRIEIPSVEGPRCLEAVIQESERYDVPVQRVSQGSGVFLLTDRELDDMATMAAQARIEVSLFVRPNAGWGPSAMARSSAGSVVAASSRGADQLAQGIDDVRRAADHGIRSVLIADIGLLAVFRALREAGEIPAEMQAKTSVMMPVANPSAAREIERLGASTINLPTDLTMSQVAAIRSAVEAPLDFYVESPEDVGGMVRLHEIPELIRVAAPVYVKFGLRDAPDVYPAGTHMEELTVALCRERVRRARLGMELLERSEVKAITSDRGAEGLAVPVASR